MQTKKNKVSLVSNKTAGQDRAAREKLAGSWMGRLESGGMYLRLIFHINLNERDTLTASLESPDQASVVIPVGLVEYRGDSVIIEAVIIGGRYTGIMKGERNIEGKWEQMGNSFPLNLEILDEPFELIRPQEPQPPFPYITEEVRIWNEKAGITLAGTLTIPEGEGPFPAAILISGSGPQNRDEEIMGHKPFAVIADHLTRNGIAVLRYDDRGVGKSEGDYTKATSAELATDAEAAFTFLQGHKSVDKARTGFIGHSEGGLIAPMVAAHQTATAFIVSLAGPGVKGEELLLKQAEEISLAMGNSIEDAETAAGINQKLYKIIRKNPDKSKAELKLVKKMTKELSRIGVEEEVIKERINNLKMTLLGDSYDWFRYFILSEPSDYWSKVTCPVLILNGEKDLQVNPTINTEGIASALAKGGNTRYAVRVFPRLNHLFQGSDTGLPGEYGTIEETFSPIVLEVITEWILKN
ncbi:MAG: alpha/beta hydrolase [Bacteroidales bacterium]